MLLNPEKPLNGFYQITFSCPSVSTDIQEQRSVAAFSSAFIVFVSNGVVDMRNDLIVYSFLINVESVNKSFQFINTAYGTFVVNCLRVGSESDNI